MLQILWLPVIPTVCPRWLVAPKGEMFTNGHIFFSNLKDILKLLEKLQGRQLKGREGRRNFAIVCWHTRHTKGHQYLSLLKRDPISLPFICRQWQKSSENAWLSISLFLPTQERQGHVRFTNLVEFLWPAWLFCCPLPCSGESRRDRTGDRDVVLTGTLGEKNVV